MARRCTGRWSEADTRLAVLEQACSKMRCAAGTHAKGDGLTPDNEPGISEPRVMQVPAEHYASLSPVIRSIARRGGVEVERDERYFSDGDPRVRFVRMSDGY